MSPPGPPSSRDPAGSATLGTEPISPLVTITTPVDAAELLLRMARTGHCHWRRHMRGRSGRPGVTRPWPRRYTERLGHQPISLSLNAAAVEIRV